METIIEPRQISGQFREARKNENGDDVHTFVASTSAPDRHNTVLNQENWNLKNFNNNPIIGYQHNVYGDGCSDPHPDDVIGKGRAYMEKGEMLTDITYDSENEVAMTIKSKVERGFLNTVSVGFIEKGDGHRGNDDDGEDKELYYFHGQELLEVSIVNIPSNPEAKKKSLRSQTFDALKYIYRQFDGKYRFSDIEDMKVRDVIEMIEGREVIPEEPEEKTNPVGEYNLRTAKLKQVALTNGH